MDKRDDIRERWARVHDRSPGDAEEEKAFSRAERFLQAVRASAGKMADGVKQESSQSREMAQTFFRMLSDRLNLESREEPPTPQEVKEAVSQLKDVGRLSFFISFSLLPGGAALLIALELLARSYGIEWFTFVPSSFRQDNKGGTGPADANPDQPV
jgi:hypothetical protein